MKIDFSEMQSQLDKLHREGDQVVEEYNKARWEDEVRASHSAFISQCKETESKINSIKSSLDSVEQVAGGVEDSSNVKHELDDIRSQADSIVV